MDQADRATTTFNFIDVMDIRDDINTIEEADRFMAQNRRRIEAAMETLGVEFIMNLKAGG